MKKLIYSLVILLFHFIGFPGCAQVDELKWSELASPDSNTTWLLPAQGKPAKPIWGHSNGIRVGLAPMPGARGLL